MAISNLIQLLIYFIAIIQIVVDHDRLAYTTDARTEKIVSRR